MGITALLTPKKKKKKKTKWSKIEILPQSASFCRTVVCLCCLTNKTPIQGKRTSLLVMSPSPWWLFSRPPPPSQPSATPSPSPHSFSLSPPLILKISSERQWQSICYVVLRNTLGALCDGGLSAMSLPGRRGNWSCCSSVSSVSWLKVEAALKERWADRDGWLTPRSINTPHPALLTCSSTCSIQSRSSRI